MIWYDMKILLIEDDIALVETIKQRLIDQQFIVDVATDGQSGWSLSTSQDYALIVLDLILPEIDGVSLCQRLRDRGDSTPILMLTASDRKSDKLRGFEAGVDDYIVKPLDLEELSARIRALLRREDPHQPRILQWERLVLVPTTRVVSYDQQALKLTPKEYALLEVMLLRPERIFSLNTIIDYLWPLGDIPSESTIRSHIKSLRRKLQAADAPENFIETVHGMGYRLRPLADLPARPAQNQVMTTTKVAEHLQALTQDWELCKDQLLKRLTILDEFAQGLSRGILNPDLQQQAYLEAHRLAGTLGSFGLATGTQLARDLMNLLRSDEPMSAGQAGWFRSLLTALNREMEQGQPTLEKDNAGGQATGLKRLSNSPKILVISDDTLWAEQLKSTATDLEVAGIVAEPAFSQPDQWPLVLSAVQLLSVDGVLFKPSTDLTTHPLDLAFLEEIISSIGPLPVILAAAAISQAERVKFASLGGQWVLDPALSHGQVVATVKQVLTPMGQGSRVMMVDDDPQFLKMIKTTLAPWSFVLIPLTDPQDFWPVLQMAQPDCVVLDLEMPQVNGMDLCRILRNDIHWANVPVIFLTVHGDAETEKQAFQSGADDYLIKPVSAADLAQRLRHRLTLAHRRQSAGVMQALKA